MNALKRSVFSAVIFCFMMISFSVIASGAEHKHIYAELYTARPTCTEKGYTVYSCDCGNSYKGNYVDALKHSFIKESVFFKAPSCTQKGEAGRYCERCYAKTDIVVYDKEPHTPETVTVKATTKSDGEKRKECSVCGKFYSSKKISKISSVKIERKTYTYDGKVKTPAITVKDKSGNTLAKNKDFTLEYQKGRKNPGLYTVKVVFKGKYAGEKVLQFKIRPAAVKNIEAIPSISSVDLSWDKTKGADGYEIYLKTDGLKLIKDTENVSYAVKKIDGKTLKSGNKYVFVVKGYKKSGDRKIYSPEKKIKVYTKPGKSAINKITSSSGKITLTVSEQNCQGYEVLLSTNKSFSNTKTVTLKGKTNVKYTFKKAVKGSRYYFKVRAYVINQDKKCYGYYSGVKSVKV